MFPNNGGWWALGHDYGIWTPGSTIYGNGNSDTNKAKLATHLLNGTFTLLLDATNVLFYPKVLRENLH